MNTGKIDSAGKEAMELAQLLDLATARRAVKGLCGCASGREIMQAIYYHCCGTVPRLRFEAYQPRGKSDRLQCCAFTGERVGPGQPKKEQCRITDTEAGKVYRVSHEAFSLLEWYANLLRRWHCGRESSCDADRLMRGKAGRWFQAATQHGDWLLVRDLMERYGFKLSTKKRRQYQRLAERQFSHIKSA